jgi:hypothetical protein
MSRQDLGDLLELFELLKVTNLQDAKQSITSLRERSALSASGAGVDRQQPTTREAYVLNAVLTAFETLQASGFYIHGTNGKTLDREQFIAAITEGLNAALRTLSPELAGVDVPPPPCSETKT